MNRISGCQKEKQLRRPKLEGVGQKKKERKTGAPSSGSRSDTARCGDFETQDLAGCGPKFHSRSIFESHIEEKRSEL